MSKIKFENVEKSLCVICDVKLQVTNFMICRNCNEITHFDYRIIGENILDIKSKCCNADINIQQKITCSDICHDKFVELLIIEKGVYQKIIDAESGKTHKVPTIVVIEEGITQNQLKNFPLWNED